MIQQKYSQIKLPQRSSALYFIEFRLGARAWNRDFKQRERGRRRGPRNRWEDWGENAFNFHSQYCPTPLLHHLFVPSLPMPGTMDKDFVDTFLAFRKGVLLLRTRALSRNSIKYRADDLCGNLICEYFCWIIRDPHFFFGRSLSFLILSIILKTKKICVWEVLIISDMLFK